ncbi:hypothetical protein M011DRAFT_95476 [Sporormia fimetaria CBS 119925]|uniref:Uncharacterized protein n=1 Tax=Sporormia fimetaria CBS 119925 TaxID=1340428 RepID=A0A6A6V8Z2_9PLEO|nr:hypothetical protein M011DRAFT_95476 [Sporormia fimetaria CBS 119925]
MLSPLVALACPSTVATKVCKAYTNSKSISSVSRKHSPPQPESTNRESVEKETSSEPSSKCASSQESASLSVIQSSSLSSGSSVEASSSRAQFSDFASVGLGRGCSMVCSSRSSTSDISETWESSRSFCSRPSTCSMRPVLGLTSRRAGCCVILDFGVPVSTGP